jgi:hypothetical protein
VCFISYLMLSVLLTPIRKLKTKLESNDVKCVFDCSLGLSDSWIPSRRMAVQMVESSDDVMCVCSAQTYRTVYSTHMAYM